MHNFQRGGSYVIDIPQILIKDRRKGSKEKTCAIEN
jgi:hypothetical protein